MQRLLIDTDPGEDDALAILMAEAHPSARVEALTVVAGNVGLPHTTNGACVVVDQLERDIPVHPGCAAPLVLAGPDAAYAHGEDGLGNSGLRSSRAPATKHAANALVDLANAAPGELTLVMLAPMTNVAVALRLDPDLPKKFARTVAMAGAVSGHGNMDGCTEFNVRADPEAAHVVFAAWGAADAVIDLVDWEVTTRHGFSAAERSGWWALGTPKSTFFAAISAHSDRWIRASHGRDVQYYADPVAMAVALEPDIVTHTECHHVAVELRGMHTRGQTVVDWQDTSGAPPNARIAMALDQARLCDLVREALA